MTPCVALLRKTLLAFPVCARKFLVVAGVFAVGRVYAEKGLPWVSQAFSRLAWRGRTEISAAARAFSDCLVNIVPPWEKNNELAAVCPTFMHFVSALEKISVYGR